jgi:glycerol dehydrogenase
MKVMISPSRYVQGPNVINDIAKQCQALALGSKALITGGKTALSIVKDKIAAAFETAGIGMHAELFQGECCDKEIERLKKISEENGADFIIGVGGGKALDTAKAVAHYLNVPIVIVPTIAATDAPTSALSVIYTEEGVFQEYLVLPKNPDLVIVDTQIIAEAPARLFVSGMGDALATWFEAAACKQASSLNLPGGNSTETALALARLCYDTLIENGYRAKLAVEKGVVTEDVEKVVEANTLLSGLGFESSGLAAAHAVHDGLTELEQTHSCYHGEKVAFGTLVQMIMENRDTLVVNQVLDFCTKVGLPITLGQLGLGEATDEELMIVAKSSCEEGKPMHNMPFPVTPEKVFAAIKAADAIGTAYLGQ